MAMRITGMNSGLDTEAIIAELVKGEKAKVDKTKKAQVSLQWKQDAWKELNSKVLKLFTGTLSNMRFTDAYSKKVTKSSNEDAVTVLTNGTATNGVQDLEVKELAKAGYLTGEKLDSTKLDSKDPNKTTLSTLAGIGADDEVSFSVTTNGKTKDITLKGSSRISDVVNQLKSAGINANFDTKNGRLFLSSKTTGEAADFALTANNDDGFAALTALGINYADSATVEEYERIAGMRDPSKKETWINSNYKSRVQSKIADLDAEIKSIDALVKNFDEKMIESYREELQKDSTYTGALDDASVLTEKRARLEIVKNDATLTEADKKRVQAEIDKIDTYTAATAVTNGKTGLEIKEEEKTAWEKKLTDFEADTNTSNIDAGFMSDAENYVEERIAYAESIVDEFEFKVKTDTNGVPMTDTNGDPILELDANGNRILASTGTLPSFSKANRITGQDAIISLNGVEYESKNNTFEINGLTITANQKTETGKPISLTTQDDTEGVYDTIKNFIKEYNAIINEMDKLYNAESAAAYQPLTAEEKEGMSESEIETWEKKIKDSILRRDSTLQDVSSTMKEVMMGGVEIGGKKYFLSSFGINTMGYFDSAKNERNAYHIDGDADDAFTSMNNDLLKKMITTDPDKVSAFFSTMAKDLYGSLDKLMKAGDVNDSSKTSLYDDKKWQIEYDAFTTRIKEQEKRVTQVEDKYYRQFSAMETALAKLQSKQSALAGLLGS